jgi:chromate transport protein ChrA
MCVEERQWIEEKEFEDAIAATNLLPGPASTQLAIYCAWRLRGTADALLGGLCFIFPGLVLILVMSAVFLANRPPDWGVGGGLLAALIAFAPSFAFVLVGGRRFDQIRANDAVRSFLTGAGLAVIGAIAGSAIPLGLAFGHLWQIPLLAGALVWIFVARRGVVSALLITGAIGVVVALFGVPA